MALQDFSLQSVSVSQLHQCIFFINPAQVSELLLLCPEVLVELVPRFATLLDHESPPRLESTDLPLVLIFLLWELLLLCCFLSFWNILQHSWSRGSRCRIQHYFIIFKDFTDSGLHSFLSFQHGHYSSEKQGTLPLPALRVIDPLPGQPEQLLQLLFYSVSSFSRLCVSALDL